MLFKLESTSFILFVGCFIMQIINTPKKKEENLTEEERAERSVSDVKLSSFAFVV